MKTSLNTRLRHRVDIELKDQTQDPVTGEVTYDWVTFLANVPAEVLTGAGNEKNVSGSKYADTTARINMRWFPGLLPTMRIVWEGREFDILGIETDRTDRREYRLKCQDGLNDGA